MTQANADHVRRYLAALESGTAGDALSVFFTGDARQIEFPNRLNPHGGESDLPTLLRRSEQGRKLLRSQAYEVVCVVAQGEIVAVEAKWNAILAVPLGTLAAGDAMSANFAMFFEMRGGRIAVQRNYDCFTPW